MSHEDKLTPASYITNVGFNMRENACGGGAILITRAVAIMAKLGITVYLSEYPDE